MPVSYGFPPQRRATTRSPRLDDPVGHRRDPEATDLAGPARFEDFPFPHRLRSELRALHRDAELVQEHRAAHLLLDPGDGPPVRTGGVGPAVVRDPVPRHDQRGRVVHEVEQVVEPATRISRRPTVKLGLHLRYPPPRTHRHRVDEVALGRRRHHSVPRFRHYSLQSLLETTAVLRHVTGSPGLGLLRRLRPAPDRSADGVPSPLPNVGDVDQGADQGRFPCSLVDRSTEEAPDSAPATSPWLPRSTSPRPPHPPTDIPGSSPPP